MIFSQQDIDRFCSHIIGDWMNNPDDCWEMDLAIDNKGYARFSIDSQSYRAHRIAYELVYGTIMDNMFVCHLCHNKRCVNPNHLDIGTHQDNMDDTVADGLQLKGSQIYQSRLTEEEVREILTRIWNNHFDTIYSVAKAYDVSHFAIDCILSGKQWKHITDELVVPLSEIRFKIVGRHLHKEVYRHPTKLTENDVRTIKFLLKSGNTAVSIAKQFNVSNSLIDSIKAGRCWNHVEV